METKIHFTEWPNINAITRGVMSSAEENVDLFNKALQEREAKYPDYVPSDKAKEVAKELEEKGHAKIENFIDTDLIDSLNERVTEILENPDNEYNQAKVSESSAKNEKLYLQCFQPLVCAKEVRDIAFNDLIVDIAGAYIDCMPALGTCNLRRSYVNNMNEGGTQIYHVDPNSPRFLKFFVYLNDVDENGGPFCYVEGSHRKKFILQQGEQGIHFNAQYSWPTQIIEDIYGKDNVKYLTAKKGDLLIADTNGWHRGIKPINAERTMLTLNYVCHYEEHRESSSFHLEQSAYDNLPEDKKAVCDLLTLV